MDLASYLDAQVRAAGVPIVGVSIGSPTDRATWKIQFAAAATTQQRTDGQTVLNAVAIDAVTLADAEFDGQFTNEKLLKAIVLWAAGKFAVTPAAAKTQILTIYRTL